MTTFNVPEGFETAINLQVTLDRAGYSARIFWCLFGQRPYITITNQYGRRILTLPLIGSPKANTYEYQNSNFVQTTENKTITLAQIGPINIIAGYFSESIMYYYPDDQTLVVLP